MLVILFLIFVQILLLLFVKTKIYGPFKVLIGYNLLFICLRYFYIDFNSQYFGLTSQDVFFTTIILITCTLFLSFVALYFELNSINKKNALYTFNNDYQWRELLAADLILIFAIICFIFTCIVRIIKFGYIIQYDWRVDVWAGLYILKIPLYCVTISTIFHYHYGHSLKAFLGIFLLFALFLIDTERQPIFLIILSIAAYFIAVQKLSLPKLIILSPVLPLLYYWVTMRRFYEYSMMEAVMSTNQIFKDGIFTEIFNFAYGRYFQVESTYLLFASNTSELKNQFNTVIWSLQAILPFDFGREPLSLSRLVCQSIDPGRWESHVSCWTYYPAIMFFDMSYLGIIISFLSLVLLYFLWSKAVYSKRIFIFAIFAFLLPTLLFHLNWTVASFFEIAYKSLYLIVIFYFTKFLTPIMIKK